MQRVGQATELVRRLGIDAACKEMNDPAGPYSRGENYVFILDFAGYYRCYPPQPRAIGQPLIDMRDADNRPLTRNMIDIARSPTGEGWTGSAG